MTCVSLPSCPAERAERAADGIAYFETALGRCGVAWGARGIVGMQLPEATTAAMRARLARRFPGVPEAPAPPFVSLALTRIEALLHGARDALDDVPPDMDDIPEFERRVYDVARAIPPGSTLTYGEVAMRLGDPALARAVGQALGRNPCPIIVPCHRVVAANGGMGGFSATGGAETKRRMLLIERAPAVTGLSLFDDLSR